MKRSLSSAAICVLLVPAILTPILLQRRTRNPSNVVRVANDAFEIPNVVSVRLDRISVVKPGRVRELHFVIQDFSRDQIDTIVYVPGNARRDAARQGQVGDFSGSIMPFSVDSELSAVVAVDDPAASRLMLGIAAGNWTSIATAKSPLRKEQPDGQLIAEGRWGSARFAKAPAIDMAKAKNTGEITIELKTPSEPVNDDLRIRAFDAGGLEIPVLHSPGFAYYSPWDVTGKPIRPIAKFTIETRPFTYYEFDNVRFDPPPTTSAGSRP